MTSSRAVLFAASSSLIAAWFVTLAVRVSVGATDASAPIALGPVPPPPAALAPLRLPTRDPFSADLLSQAPAGVGAGARAAVAALGLSGSAGAQHGQTDVPDVAAVGGAASAVGVMATIVSAHDAYALVEDRGTVRIARLHDPLAGSTIAAISDDAVVLASGLRIPLHEPAGAASAGSAPVAVPSPAWASGAPPRPLDGTAPVGPAAQPLPGAAGAQVLPGKDDGGATGAAVRPSGPQTDISTFGHTVLTTPSGMAVPDAAPARGPLPVFLGVPGTASPVTAAAGAPVGAPR
jgi:hypothetical protein